MKAAILVEQNAPLVIDEVTIPKLGIGQILVRIEQSGICGKQIDEITGKLGPDPYLPHLMGHEGAGVVLEVGPGVRKVKADDHVVVHWIKGSGIDSEPPRFDWKGRSVSAGWATTFNEMSIVSENRVTPIPTDIDFDVAALLGCAVTTGLGIVFNNIELKPGQSIAVFGTGGVGLNVIQAAALVNAHPIVAIDLLNRKLAKAKEFGATHTVNSTEKTVKAYLKDLTAGQGLDATVDTTGVARVRQLTYEVTGRCGKTILAGVPHHRDRMTIDSFPLHFGRRMFGSHGGETHPESDIPRYLQLYQLGKLKLKELITHRCGLDEINAAVDLVRRGEVGRCVIKMR
ncbi:zinc-binding dehydrogenase [bacterium]|nr:zinc-binding dehydrogenase [bacterium]